MRQDFLHPAPPEETRKTKMQIAINQISWLGALPSAPKRPQPELDPETYDAMLGIVIGVCVSAVMWVGIFCVIYELRG
jgi:hypothetical protein